MKDIYDVLIRVGKSLRDLQLLPWERQAMLKDMSQELQLMMSTLRVFVQGSAASRKSSTAGSQAKLRAHWPALAEHSGSLPTEQVNCNALMCLLALFFLNKLSPMSR